MFCILEVVAETDSVVVNYHTGYVDGVPLPGDLASLKFTTQTVLALSLGETRI